MLTTTTESALAVSGAPESALMKPLQPAAINTER